MKQVSEDIIKAIADQLANGFRAFLHRETLELVTFPNEDEQVSFEASLWKQEIDTVRKSRHKFVEVQGMEPHDSFRVMEAYIDTVSDKKLRQRLFNVLGQRKPFAHFKQLVDQSGPERQRWFLFRDQQMLEWVKGQLGQQS